MDKPVFIFSAGPRSGSTLLQRLVTSSKDILVWGEGNGSLNHTLESFKLLYISLQPGSEGGANGANHYKNFLESKGESNKWVASMNPPIQHILNTYRQLFQSLYGVPTKAMGYKQWGVKEIRSDRLAINTLKLIFPNSKFVFLVRNPIDCLRSIKKRKFLFVDNWGKPVVNNQLIHFSKNWAKLSSTYYEESGCFKIRYEDLIKKDFDVNKLCQYLEVNQLNMGLIGGKDTIIDWAAPDQNANLTNEEINQIMPLLENSMRLWKYI